jgi:hypothetical protein
MATFLQKSGVEVRFEFRDQSGQPYIPDTAHWRLVDDATDTVHQDWTAETVQATYSGVTLTAAYAVANISGSVNTIVDSRNSRELKVVTMVADKDTDREFSDEIDYYLRRGKRG